MKRMFKIGWLVLMAGLVALLVGYLNHGDRNIEFSGGRPQLQHQGSWQLTSKHFDRLDLDVSSADVTIKHGAKFGVSYQGTRCNRPRVTIKDGTLTVNQTAVGHFFFSVHGVNDHLIITVPQDVTINGGTVKLWSGNLVVDGVNLTNTKLAVVSGDADLNRLMVSGGQAHLNSGDFTARELRIEGHYRVKNSSGDNEVHVAAVDGYRLQTSSGDNTVNGHDYNDQDAVEENMTAANTLELVTQSGDNEYDN